MDPSFYDLGGFSNRGKGLVFGPSGKSKTHPVEECSFKTYVHADMHTDIHARARVHAYIH